MLLKKILLCLKLWIRPCLKDEISYGAKRGTHFTSYGKTIEIKQNNFEIINDVSGKKNGSGVEIENTECNYEEIKSL